MNESIEAYRARNDARKSHQPATDMEDMTSNRKYAEHFRQACQDVEVLIAEVERLTRALQRSQS